MWKLVLRDAEIYRQLLSGSPHFAECPVGAHLLCAAHAGAAWTAYGHKSLRAHLYMR